MSARSENLCCRFVKCFLTRARTITVSGSICFVPGLSAQAAEVKPKARKNRKRPEFLSITHKLNSFKY